jgi:NitT/TauT family transport system substrate-binding protein
MEAYYRISCYKSAGRGSARSLISAIAVAALSPAWPSHSAAQPAVTVRIGVANTSSDVSFFIADKKGYFKQEGISVTYIAFNSAAKMTAPLGAGQLDVGGGAASAGLYNAAARGINIKIVADKGSTPPGHGYQPLLVRKDLVASGKVKSISDLKGLRIASGATGISTSVTLSEALKKGGLTLGDIMVVNLGYPQHVMALQNKAVDASITTEPSATVAVASGAAVRFAGDDEIYPNHQLAVVLYGGSFIKDNPAIARKFMRAYLRAVRDYNDALKDGKLAGPNAAEIVAILNEFTAIKDPAVYKAIITHGCNPDGRVNVASLGTDLQFFKDQGLITGNVSVEQAVDNSFVEAALKDLGFYVRRSE